MKLKTFFRAFGLVVLSIITISPLTSSAETKDTNCLNSNPEFVLLKGKFNKITNPEIPNYESIQTVYKRNIYWTFTPEKSFCANFKPKLNSVLPITERNINEIQLKLYPRQYERYEKLLSKKVMVYGRLFWQQEKDEHISIIMKIRKITLSPELLKKMGCIEYEPTVVTLTGTFIQKIFPGPPNYESIKDGDKPLLINLLDLSKNPICLIGVPDDDFNATEYNITEIQLGTQGYDSSNYKKLLSKRVEVTGTLFHGMNAHQRTTVVFDVESLKVINDENRKRN